MTAYLGYDVLDMMTPNRAADIRKDTSRKVIVSGSPHGIRGAFSPSGQPVDAIPVSWLAYGTVEIEALLAFIAARRGRVVPAWVPSGQQDFSPLAVVGATSLKFRKFGYTELMYPAFLGRKRIVIYPPAGSPVYAAVVSASDNGDNTETIGTDATLTPYAGLIASSNVSFLMLCRLLTDNVDLKWESHALVQCTMRFVEVPQNEIPPPIDHSGEFGGMVE